MKGKQPKMITARQFATVHGVPYTTVIFWLKKEAIPGAEKLEIPVGRQGFIWQVPEDAPLPDLPRGPQPTKKAAKKSIKKTAKK
jgi:hypothetical protein